MGPTLLFRGGRLTGSSELAEPVRSRTGVCCTDAGTELVGAFDGGASGDIETVGAIARGRVAVVGVPELVLCPLFESVGAGSCSADTESIGVVFDRACDISWAWGRWRGKTVA